VVPLLRSCCRFEILQGLLTGSSWFELASVRLHEFVQKKKKIKAKRPRMASLPLFGSSACGATQSRGHACGALAPRDSFTRMLCYGKYMMLFPKRKAAKFMTGVERLVAYCDCAHTKFECKSSPSSFPVYLVTLDAVHYIASL
jgi:hypothetical protein